MNASRRVLLCLTLASLAISGCLGPEDRAEVAPSPAIQGSWDVTVHGPAGDYPSWFEIEGSGDSLRGRFVGKDGSARPIELLEIEEGLLRFSLPRQYEDLEGDVVYEGKFEGDRIVGKTFDKQGNPLEFTARRAPELPASDSVAWGEEISLLAGSELAAEWQVRYPDQPNGWTLKDGVLENSPPSVDILTRRKFRDFKLHVEFNMPERSNSGIYLRGRYEVQVSQDSGREPQQRSSGSIYGFIAPKVNPARPPGEWNTFDITLIGRYVTVVYNGETVIDHEMIPGTTGGALDSNEGEPGPLLLQGDHQAIQYRNLRITPAVEKAEK